ncbi:hypothetical protein [Pseudomonas chlororaphis]|uniref:hypothetical protein n=1 Tax=Pseudomonas chlororaphis TaxID=587753 RepID=UPI0015DE1845|nr:hypothetical protein [Pseudomonas chlororaphis]QLL10547.1 hypothetical protein H0I86_16990 [Pseudomonas chlororaphis subsp. aurantiaca]
MIIDITENPTGHGWVVHMDTLEVSFSSLEAATAFVGQLKARIAAPHAWPASPGLMGDAPRTAGNRSAPTTSKGACPGLVK